MAAIDRSPQLDPYRAAVQAATQQILRTAYGQAAPPTVQEVVVYEPAANPAKPGDVRRLVLLRLTRPYWKSTWAVAWRIPVEQFDAAADRIPAAESAAAVTALALGQVLVEGLTEEQLARMEICMRRGRAVDPCRVQPRRVQGRRPTHAMQRRWLGHDIYRPSVEVGLQVLTKEANLVKRDQPYVDYDDLIADGMVAVSEALAVYEPVNEVSFNRHVRSYIKRALNATAHDAKLHDANDARLDDSCPVAAGWEEQATDRLLLEQILEAARGKPFGQRAERSVQRMAEGLARRFCDGDTLQEVAVEVGVSRERARQWEAEGLRMCRAVSKELGLSWEALYGR